MNYRFFYVLLLLTGGFLVSCNDDAPTTEPGAIERPLENATDLPDDGMNDIRRRAITEDDVTGRLNNAFDKIEKLMNEDAAALRIKSATITATEGCQINITQVGTDGVTRETRFNLSDFVLRDDSFALQNDDDADVEFPAVRMFTDRRLAKVEYYEDGSLVKKDGYFDVALASKEQINKIAAVLPQVIRTCNNPIID